MSWLEMHEEEEGVGGSTRVWHDTFTESVSTLITNHTPDIGTSYPLGRTINNTAMSANNPNMTVNGVLTYGNVGGPIFDVGVVGFRALLTMALLPAAALSWRYGFRMNYAAGNRGWRVSYTTVGTPNIHILDPANVNRGTYNVTLSVGDIIQIIDTGTNDLGWLTVYVNGVLVLTCTVTGSVETYTEHSVWIHSNATCLDDLEVWTLE